MYTAYNPASSAVIKIIYTLLDACKKSHIETTTSFLTPLKSIIPTLLSKGLTSFTLQADRINEVAELVSKIETQ